MTEFITLLLLTSLWCFGFRAFFQEDMIFEKLGDKLWGETHKLPSDLVPLKKGWLPVWLCKPLFQCPQCMSSIHGTYAFFALYNTQPITILDTVLLWVAFCVCLCGLNYLITKIVLE